MSRKNQSLKASLLPRRVQSTPLSASSTQHTWELLAGDRTAVLPRHARGRRIISLSFENTELNCSTAKRIEISTLHSKFLEILKFVFLFEVAHMQEPIMGSWQTSFWVKFSGLISQLKILQKSRIQVREYSTYRFIFVLYLRLNKVLCCTYEAFQIILLKSHNRHCFFLAVDNKKFQRATASATAYGTNEYPPDDWLKTG